jgi:hypothetical protein
MKKIFLSILLFINISTQAYTQALSQFFKIDKVSEWFKTNISNRKKLITAVQDLDFNSVSMIHKNKNYTDDELREAQKLVKAIMLLKKYNYSWHANYKALSKVALGLISTTIGSYLFHELLIRNNDDLKDHFKEVFESDFAPLHFFAFSAAISSTLIMGPLLVYGNIQKLRALHQPEYKTACAINTLLEAK